MYWLLTPKRKICNQKDLLSTNNSLSKVRIQGSRFIYYHCTTQDFTVKCNCCPSILHNKNKPIIVAMKTLVNCTSRWCGCHWKHIELWLHLSTKHHQCKHRVSLFLFPQSPCALSAQNTVQHEPEFNSPSFWMGISQAGQWNKPRSKLDQPSSYPGCLPSLPGVVIPHNHKPRAFKAIRFGATDIDTTHDRLIGLVAIHQTWSIPVDYLQTKTKFWKLSKQQIVQSKGYRPLYSYHRFVFIFPSI